MKELKLFVDFEFTSLSPDAQPISIGVVSEDILTKQVAEDFLSGNNNPCLSKSFYAEFSDFDINRCDDWVKENVVGKLRFSDALVKQWKINGINNGVSFAETNDSTEVAYGNSIEFWSHSARIKERLKEWLSQFSDYQITFVVDCGTWDWYHLIQLLDERERLPCQLIIDEAKIPNDTTLEELIKAFQKQPLVIMKGLPEAQVVSWYQSGLPILPSNVSPVPMDLNDLIAHKKGISVREAFEFNREELLIEDVVGMVISEKSTLYGEPMQKHNALWDAKVMKAIYEKLR